MLAVDSAQALTSGKSPNNGPGKQNGSLVDPFVFVPITHTEAARGRGAAKRIVRAHVTRVQHAKSSTLNGMDLQSWTVKPYMHRDSLTVRKKPRNKAKTDKDGEGATTIVKIKKRPSIESSSSTSSSSSSSALSSDRSEGEIPKALVLPKLADNAAEDPFWTFAVDYKPEIAPMFAHCKSVSGSIEQILTLQDIQNIAVDMVDIDGPTEKGLLRRSLFPLCMTEASTMYAVLLMAASHYCVVNPHKAKLIDLLALKARALTEINAALTDPKKALTDAVIMSVAKIAAYESIFGDSQVFAAHMRGLQMMLKMRGGLSTLGLSGLLERMLVWIDLNACHLTGQPVFLGGEDIPTIVSFEGPDPFHFAGIS